MGHYMTKEERIIMQTLLDEKKPVSYIARKLGCCRQTVYNEIRRGQYLHNYGYYDKLRYSADKGQQIHDYNQTAKGRPLKIGSDHAFAAYIEHKIIVDRYSPAAALAAARKYPFATRIRLHDNDLLALVVLALGLHLTFRPTSYDPLTFFECVQLAFVCAHIEPLFLPM